MISGSVVVPFQKGPCGENGRWRGFLLCWLEAAAAVVLVLFLTCDLVSRFAVYGGFPSGLLTTKYWEKVNGNHAYNLENY